MEEKTCISCKTITVNDDGSVSFQCPQCSDFEVNRCTRCRSNAVRYTCPSCNFIGPN